MARTKTKAEPIDTRRPDRWDGSHGTYITGRATLDGVDVIAADMEARWGAGRLRLVVGPQLREKFDRQRYLLDAAIREGNLQDVLREGARMITAWQVLDREAEKGPAQPVDASVWEVPLVDGTVAAIVQTASAVRLVQPEGRYVAVYTLEEIGHLLGTFPAIVKAKQVFPGASVVRVSRNVNDPLEGVIARSLDEPLPDDQLPF